MELNRTELRSVLSIIVVLLLMSSHAVAYDPLDPTGNITIKWDIMSWTADGYVAMVVPSTTFLTPDKRRKTQALMTWNVTCTYSQFLASKHPTCCVSFSSFYNDTIIPCPSCACGCENKNCVKSDSKILSSPGINTPKKDNTPLLQCTHHMCPVRVHWHVKLNYKEYWRAKIAITNFNYRMNYTQWTLVVQHPNLDNVTEVFSFEYKPLVAYGSINDTGMFYGMKYYNDLLMEAGAYGNVQSEVLLRKNADAFTFKQGWAFPRKVYFNGDECMLPPPDVYPYLPNSSPLSDRVVLHNRAAPLLALLLLLMAAPW
ncbi:hypothetical protein OPV22_017890 [Ensete ventricosum]|uniref:COBRA C-terminal domain-containing protein n=1 Tax=Ensete ventricosum TaxID=4639 RepID=A0AAV8QUP4_ENSVE|nr:hypothetical protein OPV22_017890 [Ensete ventricosum]